MKEEKNKRMKKETTKERMNEKKELKKCSSLLAADGAISDWTQEKKN